MSTILTGNPANVTTPLVRNVSNVTNNGSGLFRVTTSAAHLFGDDGGTQGDTVVIASVTGTGGMTAAINGTWNIRVINSTNFDLLGSTFVGTYTSGGTATDTSLTPQIQVPSDGDQASMNASLLSALQGLLDRTQYVNQRVAKGTLRLIGLYSTGQATTLSGTIFSGAGWKSTTSIVPGNAQNMITLPNNPQIGDQIDVQFQTSVVLQAALGVGGDYRGALDVQSNQNGGGFSGIGVVARMGWSSFNAADIMAWPTSITATDTVSSAGPYILAVNGCVDSQPAVPNLFCLVAGWNIVVRHWRPN